MVGLVSLCGWIFDLHPGSISPGLVGMKANTAVCFILAGFSLLVQARPGPPLPPSQLYLARVLALVVLGVGFLTLMEYIFGWELGLDQLLFRETLEEAGPSFPGRMAPASAFSFLLLGLALLLLDIPIGKEHWPAQYAAEMAVAVGLLAFIGYFYGVEVPFRVAPYVSIALHSVIAFWLLSLGILFARPHRGAMAVFTSDSPGGLLARRLLPAAILVPLFAGWLRVLGERGGWYGLGLGSSMFATLLIVFFTVLIISVSRTLNRVDAERCRNEQTLRESEIRKRAVVESALDCIITMDQDGRITEFNPAAEKVFAWRREHILGRTVTETIMPPEFRQAHENGIANLVDASNRRLAGKRIEVTALRSDGSRFPAELAIAVSHLNDRQFFTAYLRDMSQVKQAHEELRALAGRLQTVREEERSSVARQIHDVLAQELTRLKIDIVWLVRRLQQPLDATRKTVLEERLASMLDLANAAIGSVQKIATELRPVVLDTLGLCAAIEWQAKEFETRTGIRCFAQVPEGPVALDREHSTAVFRILQETLTNVMRHSGASRVEIGLVRASACINLVVRDNGRGIRPEEVNDPHSLGLLGMRERATLLGGVCEIRGAPGGGTTVEVQFPTGSTGN